MMQAKLLRVIDDGEVRPVGSEQVQQVSVRFIAATNRDALAMIGEGTLREDLYYRLRGCEIALPTLRDRREDIPLLAHHFLGADAAGFNADALERLTRAPWPGNVRELRNVVQAAKAAAGDARIGPSHLEVAFAATDRLGASSAPAQGAAASDLPGGATLREVERRAIVEALRECSGNRTRAARSLGIDRSTLRRKIREFGIE